MTRLLKRHLIFFFILGCFAQIIYQSAFSFFKDWSINFEVKIVRRKTTTSPMGNLRDSTNYRETISGLSTVKSSEQLMEMEEKTTHEPFTPEFDYQDRWHNVRNHRTFRRFHFDIPLGHRNMEYEQRILRGKLKQREGADKIIVESRTRNGNDKDSKETRVEEISSKNNTPSSNNTVEGNNTSADIVFIRVHKCASLTLANIFRRFCVQHKLACGIPYPGKFTLGWPNLFRREFVRPIRKRPNVISEHMVFNYEDLQTIMSKNTYYIASIRNPFDQFVSMFNHEKFYKAVGLHPFHAVSTYLKNVKYYDNLFKSSLLFVRRNRYACLDDGFSVGINLIIYN